MLKLLKLVAGYAAAAYTIDVPVRRALLATQAQRYARTREKPLLNIGAGTKRSALFGQYLIDGAINTDLCGRSDVPHGTRGVVTYADAQDLSQFATGSIGAVFASHVLEHLPNPDRALQEWLRVVGGDKSALFILTPSWWAPHTWLHPGHAWFWMDAAGGLNGGKRYPLRKPAELVAACEFMADRK